MPYKLDVNYNEILRFYIEHHPDGDREGIKRAFKYAEKLHEGTLRGSGEPYINHPMRTARLLAEQGFESDYLIAALLHDVVEDCGVSISEIKKQFGSTVSMTVDAVTALSDRDFGEKKPSKRKRDSLSDAKLQEKMNNKALYVKIADRIDNLATISGVKEEKRQPKAEHTREILIPMAERAKAFYYVDVLEDLCFHIEHPGELAVMEEIRDRICTENRQSTGRALQTFAQVFDPLRKNPYKALEPYRRHIISFRQQDRTMVSIFRQIISETEDSKKLENILRKDTFAFYDLFLIVSNDLEEEGTPIRTHDLFFKYFDLALSKRGFYFVDYKRTTHKDATYFLLADEMDNLYRLFIRTQEDYNRYLHGNIIDDSAFYAGIVNEIEPRDTYNPKIKVFCADGAAMKIDKGATVLDFAFHIHTDLGLHFQHAQLNGEKTFLPAHTRLNEGDTVFIQENENVTPTFSWFKYLRTSRAKDHLVRYFYQQYPTEKNSEKNTEKK
ncbi:MAG: HD domain-containing protein [Eubacteriales bacterium]|nr:HD domain-containing protein [Eubacteriales bacterium]